MYEGKVAVADDDGYGRKKKELDEKMGLNTPMLLARRVVGEAMFTAD